MGYGNCISILISFHLTLLQNTGKERMCYALCYMPTETNTNSPKNPVLYVCCIRVLLSFNQRKKKGVRRENIKILAYMNYNYIKS